MNKLTSIYSCGCFEYAIMICAVFKKCFVTRGGYNLGEKFNVEKHCVLTTKMSMCITVRGVDLWNGLKQSTNIKQF